MTARAFVWSAALHLVVLVVVALVAATSVKRPAMVDIELVGPAPVALAPAPAPVPALDRGHDAEHRDDRILDRVPARRAQPMRNPRHVHRVAAPRLAAAVPSAPDPMATDVAPGGAAELQETEASEPAAGDGSDLAGSGGAGEGAGGSGGGAPDLSARPVPLETSTSRTLPYTAEAQRDHVSGDVHLVLTVDPLGRVGRATVRRGLGHGLDEIATMLARQIRFRPARDRTGKPTIGTVRWRFHFQPP